jgi:hypothetical protein
MNSQACVPPPPASNAASPRSTAGLSLPYSSGTVEGHVNRMKMIKRQMYGRANVDLLRRRILAPT